MLICLPERQFALLNERLGFHRELCRMSAVFAYGVEKSTSRNLYSHSHMATALGSEFRPNHARCTHLP